MNRRLCVWFAALGMGLSGSLAFAQPGPATNPSAVPGISSKAKIDDLMTASQKQEVVEFITQEMGYLTTGDPSTQKIAVARLGGEVPKGATTYSAQFLDSYAATIDQQVVAQLNKQPSIRVRLNLAIVSATVAENTKSNQQIASTIALLNDPVEGVALWGMKTAKFVLPAMLQVQVASAKNLLPLMVSTGMKFPGPVLNEAYEGLTLSSSNILVQPKAKIMMAQKQILAVIPSIQDLLAKRNATWSAGLPKEPILDAQGTNFLVNDTIWNSIETPIQQKQTLTLMRDLLDNASKAFGTATGQDKVDLTTLISTRLGQAFGVVGDQNVVGLTIDVRRINKDTATPKAQAACDALIQAVNAMPIMQGAGPAPVAPVTQGPTSRATSGTSPAGTLAGIK